MSDWISVKEKLPDEEKYYLVTFLAHFCNEPTVEYCLFQNGKWYIVADGNYEENTSWKEQMEKVVAWMPLPEPCKEE